MLDLRFADRSRRRAASATALVALVLAAPASVALAAHPFKATTYRGGVRGRIIAQTGTNNPTMGHIKLTVSSNGQKVSRFNVRLDFPFCGYSGKASVSGIKILSHGKFKADVFQDHNQVEVLLHGQFIHRGLVKVYAQVGYPASVQGCYFILHGTLPAHR